MFSVSTFRSKNSAKNRRELAVWVAIAAVVVFLSGCATVAPGSSQPQPRRDVDLIGFLQGVQQVQRDAYENDWLIRERNEATSGGQLPMRPVIYNTYGQ